MCGKDKIKLILFVYVKLWECNYENCLLIVIFLSTNLLVLTV